MATELATAYLSLYPKLSGNFGSDAAAQASRSLDGKSVGGKFGGDAGNSFSAAFGAGVGKLGKAFAAIGIGTAVAGFAKDSVAAGMDFDAAMSQVAATMGTTVDEIGELRDFAKEMGSTTKFSARESAEALNFMALAGYDAETSMKMLPNVLNLAAAGGMDLARASDMVTDTQSALGLSLDETTALVDKMAAASSKTNTSVGQLGDALLTVGGTAKNLTGGTTEAAQALGLLADNGIKGSEGGTALRNVLLGLSSDKFAKTFGEMGVAVYDADGKMRGLKDIFSDMNVAMEGMTVEQKTEAISAAFNKVDLKSVNALLGTNAERWDEVAEAIDGSQGAAQAMADTQLDNLQGDVTTFQSALEGLQIAISDAVTPALRGLVQLGTEGLGGLTSAMGAVGEGVQQFSEGLMGAIDFEGFKAAFQSIADAVSAAFGEAPQLNVKGFGELVGNVINGLVPVIEALAPVIGAVAEVVAGTVDVVTTAVGSVVSLVTDSMPSVSDTVSEVMGAVKSAVDTVWPLVKQGFDLWVGAIKGIVTAAWPVISGAVKTAMGAIQTVVRTVWPVVQGVVSAATGAIKAAISGISAVVGGVKTTFDSIKTAISTAIDAAKGAVSAATGAIKAAISGVSSVVSGVQSTFNSIKSAISGAIDAAKGAVDSAMGGIGSALDGAADFLEPITEAFDAVGDAISDPIGTAKDAVEGAMSAIADAFDIELSFPTFSLPTITVDGGEAPWGIGGQGRLPSFDVQWNAIGGILDRATLIGAGEAGREAIMPLEGRYMRPFAQTVASEMGGGGDTWNINLQYDADADATRMVRDIARKVRLVRLAEGA